MHWMGNCSIYKDVELSIAFSQFVTAMLAVLENDRRPELLRPLRSCATLHAHITASSPRSSNHYTGEGNKARCFISV